MTTSRTNLLKVRITPAEEGWLKAQAGSRSVSDFVRSKIFDTETPASPEEPPKPQNVQTTGEYKPQAKYPSGNEGRHHPGLRHDGYFGPKTPYVNEKRLEVAKRFRSS